MSESEVALTNGHRCAHRGLVKYPSIDKTLWDPSSSWILQWDNIVKHPGARARGCHCDIHKPPWLYPNLGTLQIHIYPADILYSQLFCSTVIWMH